MRYSFLLIIYLFAVAPIAADGLKVISFSINSQDLSARTEPRMSNTGKNCALIKVQCPIEGLSFEGNIVGDVKHENSVYWVYMDEISDFLLIRLIKGDPLLLSFSDSEIVKLESNTTYELQVLLEKYDYSTTYELNSGGERNGHQYVDLGLSVYWATCNVGAKSPNEKGWRFAWGETSPKSKFSLNNYKFYSGIQEYDYNNVYTKYPIEEENNLFPSDDAASVNWGSGWRLPNKEELIELMTSCTFFYTYYEGTLGLVVTGVNGNTIFLPHVETEDTETIYKKSKCGEPVLKVRDSKLAKYCCSYSTLFYNLDSVIALDFNNLNEEKEQGDCGDPIRLAGAKREEGFSIRPVLPKTK